MIVNNLFPYGKLIYKLKPMMKFIALVSKLYSTHLEPLWPPRKHQFATTDRICPSNFEADLRTCQRKIIVVISVSKAAFPYTVPKYQRMVSSTYASPIMVQVQMHGSKYRRIPVQETLLAQSVSQSVRKFLWCLYSLFTSNYHNQGD